MSLVVGISKPKNVSEWVDYKDTDGNVLARFKIRGIGYKSYQVAIERANNQIATKGYNVELADNDDKLFPELILDCIACHLIEDWDGIAFSENGVEKKATFTTENAKKLLGMGGGISTVIAWFIKDNAERIQREADGYKTEILGKSDNSTDGQNTEMMKQQEEK